MDVWIVLRDERDELLCAGAPNEEATAFLRKIPVELQLSVGAGLIKELNEFVGQGNAAAFVPLALATLVIGDFTIRAEFEFIKGVDALLPGRSPAVLNRHIISRYNAQKRL